MFLSTIIEVDLGGMPGLYHLPYRKDPALMFWGQPDRAKMMQQLKPWEHKTQKCKKVSFLTESLRPHSENWQTHRTKDSVSLVAEACLALCNPMNCSMPGLSVHHQLRGFTQTHVHWDGDAIQSSHPLSSPSAHALNLSQASGSFPLSQLFTWGGQCTGVSTSASVLPMNTQDWSPLGWTPLGSPCSPRDSQEFSPSPKF